MQHSGKAIRAVLDYQDNRFNDKNGKIAYDRITETSVADYGARVAEILMDTDGHAEIKIFLQNAGDAVHLSPGWMHCVFSFGEVCADAMHLGPVCVKVAWDSLPDGSWWEAFVEMSRSPYIFRSDAPKSDYVCKWMWLSEFARLTM